MSGPGAARGGDAPRAGGPGGSGPRITGWQPAAGPRPAPGNEPGPGRPASDAAAWQQPTTPQPALGRPGVPQQPGSMVAPFAGERPAANPAAGSSAAGSSAGEDRIGAHPLDEAEAGDGQAGDGPVGGDRAGEGAGEPVPLTGWGWLTGGMLALVAGVLWAAQGFDLVEDSLLSGQSALTVAGPVVAVAGLALIVVGVRTRDRAKRLRTAAEDRTAA